MKIIPITAVKRSRGIRRDPFAKPFVKIKTPANFNEFKQFLLVELIPLDVEEIDLDTRVVILVREDGDNIYGIPTEDWRRGYREGRPYSRYLWTSGEVQAIDKDEVNG